jgi:uncharacterized protein YrrD
MEISLNARVNCSDGPIGKSVRVIVNPVTTTVTHFTVRPDGMGESEHVVPITDISTSNEKGIELAVSKNQFYLYPLFESHRFINFEDASLSPEDVESLPEARPAMNPVLWPFVTADGHMGTYADVQQIPANELAIQRGAPVEASDGHVGEVSELVIDPDTNQVTHLVLHKGHLFGHHDIAVPIADLDRVDEGIVYLKIDKAAVKDLPDIKIKR